MDKKFDLTLKIGCNYLSTLWLNFNHVSKRAPGKYGCNLRCVTFKDIQGDWFLTHPVSWTLREKIEWNIYQMKQFSTKKLHLKASLGKCRPFCWGINTETQRSSGWLPWIVTGDVEGYVPSDDHGSYRDDHSVFIRGQVWPSAWYCHRLRLCVCPCVCQSVCQSLACPRDNSRPVQARIAKFGPKMQKTLVKVPIVLGGNWPWPSR